MRALLTTQPGTGHLHSMLPLARAMTAAGHDVLFATAAQFCPTIAAAGFPAVPAGLDFLQSTATDTFPALQAMPGEDAAEFWMRSVWLDAVPAQKIPDLVLIVRQWRPHVVVHDFWDFAAPLAAEVMNVPHVVHLIAPLMPPAAMAAAFASEFAALRRIAGLAPDPQLRQLYRYLCLDHYPPGLQPPGSHRPAVTHRIRPGPFAVRGEMAPDWLAAMPYAETVFVGLGTVFGRMPELLGQILRGLHAEKVNVVATLGNALADPSVLGSQPAHVRVEPFLRQHILLEHSDLCITHAGPNTIAEALMNGLPMLCVPLSAEQPVNAANCVRAGIALALQPASVTPDRVRSLVRRLRTERGFWRSAQQVRDRMLQLPDATHAVTLLEQLARTRLPILNRHTY